jgi:hypothetical protein
MAEITSANERILGRASLPVVLETLVTPGGQQSPRPTGAGFAFG